MAESEQAERRVARRKSRGGRKPKSKALTTTFRRIDLDRRYLPAPAGADLRRWFLYEGQGMSVQDIAAREKNTRPDIVQASLDYIKEYMFRNQTQVLNAETVQMARERLGDASMALKGAMKADKVVHVDRETGKIKTVPDHAMRIKGVMETRRIIETMQPRQPGVMLNQQFNSNVAVNGYRPGMSFESRLRFLREKRGMKNEDEFTGEIIEASDDEGSTVEEELAEIGIDLKDADQTDNEDAT